MSTQPHGVGPQPPTPGIPEWTIGDKLRKARAKTGLTVRDFAQLIGISPKSVNNYEGDHVEPRPIVLNAWALATGVPRTWLEKDEAPRGDGLPNEGPSELRGDSGDKRTRRDLNSQPSDPKVRGLRRIHCVPQPLPGHEVEWGEAA